MSGNIIGNLILWLVVAVIVIAVVVYLLNWLYHRSTKEVAFVRTGLGGENVVINGGALVLPIVHETTPVNLNVVRIPVSRRRDDAVISRDRMRVDIDAEFFVRVIQAPESVAAAASTLGRRTLEADALADLLGARFVGALRSVAAEKTLDQMHEQRADFVHEVEARVRESLASNGLELESVAITDLDQAALDYFDPSNRFDAEGLTQLIGSIEERRRVRNDIEQSAMLAIRGRNLEAEKETLELERASERSRLDQAQAVEEMRAAQAASIEMARAAQQSQAEAARFASQAQARQAVVVQRLAVDTAELQAQANVERARIESHEAVENARIAEERTLDKARMERDRELRTAQVAQRQAVEEHELVAREEVERARIATESGLDEARVIAERALRRIEIEREQLVELAGIERRIAVLAKEAEASEAEAGREAARGRAVLAAEEVATGREQAVAQRIAGIDRLIAQKDADTTRITAEAERITAVVAAEAERLRNEADNVLSADARATRLRERMVDRLEGIVRESVRPMEKIDGIRILHVDGLGGGGNDVKRSPTDEVIESALRYRAQAPLIDEMMKEIGVEGAGVARMGDIFRSARDAQSLAKATTSASHDDDSYKDRD